MADSDEPTPSPDSSPMTTPPETFTPASRIAELNTVDTSIPLLLSSAATATGILSNSPSCAPNPPPTNLESAQTALTNAVDTFFSTLSAIEVRLRRNIYALEEAGLIEAGDEKDAKKGRTLGIELVRAARGPLDPSWLNAQADNGVEAKLRKEVLKEVQEFLENSKGKGNG